MLPVAILSLVALVSASPVDLYTDALNKREVSASDFNSFKFYVQHANAAYCNSEGAKAGDAVECDGWCDDVERNNATIINTFSGSLTGIAGYASVDDARGEIVLSFRGSSNIRNFVTDVVFAQEPCDLVLGCKVHVGFAQAWDELSRAATTAVRDGVTANPSYKFVVTGHSLGGAVAHLAAAYLRREGYNCDLYTYGSPRVGNKSFATFLSNQQGSEFRITHEDDPIPRLPPIVFGYRHTTPEYWVNNGASESTDYTASDIEVCKGTANVSCNGGTFGFNMDSHRQYFGRTGCEESTTTAKRDNVSDAELEQRLNEWSQKDQDLVNNGQA